MSSDEKKYQQYLRTVVIDFDDTLFHSDYPKVFNPIKNACQILKAFKRMGLYIIINTARCSDYWDKDINVERDKIEEYLNLYNIPFDEIWVRQGKACGKWYIDDHNIEFDSNDNNKDWINAYNKVMNEYFNLIENGELKEY